MPASTTSMDTSPAHTFPGIRDLAVPAARILFSAIFVFAGFSHFDANAIAYAAQAGVPIASLAVPLSGLIALAGGVSVAVGYHARAGALLLAAFLVPVTLMLHAFWAVEDPVLAQVERAMFLKNAGLFGGALLIARFGAGPLSLDELRSTRRPRAAGRGERSA